MAMAEVISAHRADNRILMAHCGLDGKNAGYLHSEAVPHDSSSDTRTFIPDRRRVVTCRTFRSMLTVYTSDLVPLDQAPPPSVAVVTTPIPSGYVQISAAGDFAFVATEHAAGTTLISINVETGMTMTQVVSKENGVNASAFNGLLLQGNSAVAFAMLQPI